MFYENTGFERRFSFHTILRDALCVSARRGTTFWSEHNHKEHIESCLREGHANFDLAVEKELRIAPTLGRIIRDSIENPPLSPYYDKDQNTVKADKALCQKRANTLLYIISLDRKDAIAYLTAKDEWEKSLEY